MHEVQNADQNRMRFGWFKFTNNEGDPRSNGTTLHCDNF